MGKNDKDKNNGRDRRWTPRNSGDVVDDFVRFQEKHDKLTKFFRNLSRRKRRGGSHSGSDSDDDELAVAEREIARIRAEMQRQRAAQPQQQRRSRTQHRASCAHMVEQASSPVSVFNALAFQMAGDQAPHVQEEAQLDEAFEALFDTYGDCEGGWYRVLKATQSEVVINTPVGQETIVVPSSTRQLEKSPHKAKWLAADRKALDVSILGFDGNKKVPITVPRSNPEAEVTEVVVQRRLKTEGNELAANDPFKSRIALDAKRRPRQRQLLRRPPCARGRHPRQPR